MNVSAAPLHAYPRRPTKQGAARCWRLRVLDLFGWVIVGGHKAPYSRFHASLGLHFSYAITLGSLHTFAMYINVRRHLRVCTQTATVVVARYCSRSAPVFVEGSPQPQPRPA